jgi:hypothetical protein
VPTLTKEAAYHRLRAETAFAALGLVYADLIRLAHSQPEKGPFRKTSFDRAELLSGVIQSVRRADPSDEAAAAARANIHQFLAGLSVEDDQKEITNVAA